MVKWLGKSKTKIKIAPALISIQLESFQIESFQNWIPLKLNSSRNNSLQIESIQSWIPSKLNSFRTIPFRIESLPNWSLSKSNPFNIWSLENWILWKLKGSINEISLFKSESLQILYVNPNEINSFKGIPFLINWWRIYLPMGSTELGTEISFLSTSFPKIPKILGDKDVSCSGVLEQSGIWIEDDGSKKFFSILEHNDFSSVVKVMAEMDCWIWLVFKYGTLDSVDCGSRNLKPEDKIFLASPSIFMRVHSGILFTLSSSSSSSSRSM